MPQSEKQTKKITAKSCFLSCSQSLFALVIFSIAIHGAYEINLRFISETDSWADLVSILLGLCKSSDCNALVGFSYKNLLTEPICE